MELLGIMSIEGRTYQAVSAISQYTPDPVDLNPEWKYLATFLTGRHACTLRSQSRIAQIFYYEHGIVSTCANRLMKRL
jgi:hypothetical protein